jgi:hypothetical protein
MSNESCGLNIPTVLYNIHKIKVFVVMQSHESTFRSRMLCRVQWQDGVLLSERMQKQTIAGYFFQIRLLTSSVSVMKKLRAGLSVGEVSELNSRQSQKILLPTPCLHGVWGASSRTSSMFWEVCSGSKATRA